MAEETKLQWHQVQEKYVKVNINIHLNPKWPYKNLIYNLWHKLYLTFGLREENFSQYWKERK